MERLTIFVFYTILCVSLLAPSAAFCLAPETRVQEGEADELYVIRAAQDGMRVSGVTHVSIPELYSVLENKLKGTGLNLSGLMEKGEIVEILVIPPKKNWAISFYHRPRPATEAGKTLADAGLEGSGIYRIVTSMPPRIFAAEYRRRARAEALTKTIDGSSIPGWSIPRKEMAELADRAVPWNEYQPQNRLAPFTARIIELERLSGLKVNIVKGEGALFQYRTRGGERAELYTIYEYGDRVAPAAMLIPEGALDDEKLRTFQWAALNMAVKQFSIYSKLRGRLEDRIDFDADRAMDRELWDAACNIALLSDNPVKGIPFLTHNIIIRARNGFLAALIKNTELFKKWTSSNAILNMLTAGDAASIDIPPKNIDGAGLILELQGMSDRIRRFASLFAGDEYGREQDAGRGPATSANKLHEDAELETLFAAGDRIIAFGDVEAADERLSDYARKEGRPYLRVTVEDLNDWDKFMTEKRPAGGNSYDVPGKLQRIIDSNGILLVDFEGSRPDIIARLYPLFEKKGCLGPQKVRNGLTVVGCSRNDKPFLFDRGKFSRACLVDISHWTAKRLTVVKVQEGRTALLSKKQLLSDTDIARYFHFYGNTGALDIWMRDRAAMSGKSREEIRREMVLLILNKNGVVTRYGDIPEERWIYLLPLAKLALENKGMPVSFERGVQIYGELWPLLAEKLRTLGIVLSGGKTSPGAGIVYEHRTQDRASGVISSSFKRFLTQDEFEQTFSWEKAAALIKARGGEAEGTPAMMREREKLREIYLSKINEFIAAHREVFGELKYLKLARQSGEFDLISEIIKSYLRGGENGDYYKMIVKGYFGSYAGELDSVDTQNRQKMQDDIQAAMHLLEYLDREDKDFAALRGLEKKIGGYDCAVSALKVQRMRRSAVDRQTAALALLDVPKIAETVKRYLEGPAPFEYTLHEIMKNADLTQFFPAARPKLSSPQGLSGGLDIKTSEKLTDEAA